jgi:hypothetical protein
MFDNLGEVEAIVRSRSIHDFACYSRDPQSFPAIPPEFGKWTTKDHIWDQQWEKANPEFKKAPWKHYEKLLVGRGYKLYFMPSNEAEFATMPTYESSFLQPTQDPFNPREDEFLRFSIVDRPPAPREFLPPVRLVGSVKFRAN